MTNFSSFTLTAIIELAKANNVEIPTPAFVGRHPLAVRKQYVVDALRQAGF